MGVIQTFAKLCGVEQRAPPIFGMAAITLGIGPHSSFVIHWIISFLTDRTQATKLGLLDLSLSTLLSINRPFVQGSGIGPTLFIMFACDLKPLDMSNYLLKYADDASLLSPHNSPTPIELEMPMSCTGQERTNCL